VARMKCEDGSYLICPSAQVSEEILHNIKYPHMTNVWARGFEAVIEDEEMDENEQRMYDMQFENCEANAVVQDPNLTWEDDEL